MKKSKFIKIGIKVLITKLFNIQKPVSVTLSVTNNCNSSCIYCGYKNREHLDLSTEEIKKIIDVVCKLGVERIGIWGGEPLIRKDIGQIIDYIISKGLYVTLDTNGYLIKDKLEIIKKVNHIIVSFDGLEECHDINRGKNSYKRVFETIKFLSENQIKFSTITVLTKNNISKKNIDFILELSTKYHFSTTFQILHHNSKIGADYKAILPTDKEYKEILTYIYNKKKENKLIANSDNYFKYLLNWNNLRKVYSNEKTKIKCMESMSYFNIDTNGKLYPCSILIDDISGIDYNSKNPLKKIKKIKDKIGCNSCVCGCFVEYNNLFSLNISTVFQWIKNLL